MGFTEYGFTKQSSSIGVTLNLLYDTRMQISNPAPNSSFLNIIYRNNASFLGSDQNWQSITLDYRKYIPFPKGSKNILAFGLIMFLPLRANNLI